MIESKGIQSTIQILNKIKLFFALKKKINKKFNIYSNVDVLDDKLKVIVR